MDSQQSLKRKIANEANFPKDTDMVFVDNTSSSFTFITPNRDLTKEEYLTTTRTFSQAIEKLEATYAPSTNCECRMYTVNVQCVPFANAVTGFQLYNLDDDADDEDDEETTDDDVNEADYNATDDDDADTDDDTVDISDEADATMTASIELKPSPCADVDGDACSQGSPKRMKVGDTDCSADE